MQKLSFRSRDYSRILFSSDYHIDHRREFIFQDRGFSSWEEHTAFIEKALNELTNDDLLIYLGDFALNTSDERVKFLLNGIKAESYFIYGNHFSGLKSLYKAAKLEFFGGEKDVDVYPLKIAPKVTLMGDDFLVSIDGRKFYCNHFAPMIWDGMQHGWGCCCAHSHGSLDIANPESKEIRLLDVGVDNALKYNGTPFFSFQEVCEIMDSKKIFVPDGHARQIPLRADKDADKV